MAKDGTNRGGARPGTGPKKKALVDKINEGKLEGAMILPEPAEFEGVDVPRIISRQRRKTARIYVPRTFSLPHISG